MIYQIKTGEIKFIMIKKKLVILLVVYTVFYPEIFGRAKVSSSQYNFDQSEAKIIHTSIHKNMLELSDLTVGFQTAFLEVKVNVPGIFHLAQPRVELSGNIVKAVQYFEYRAKGLRYINISKFIQHKENKIILNTKKCKIAGGEHRIILFKNQDIENENLVVLAPHPDDAEIAAYGLYASNKNAFVATITIGDAGKKMYDELYPDDSIHYIKKGGIRFWNSITVPMLAGLQPQNIVNLGYFDASLKQMYNDTAKNAMARYTGIGDINIYRKQNISGFLDSIKI